MATVSKENEQLMKTVFIERLGELIPTLLKWFEAKEGLVEEFNKVNREILQSMDRFSAITHKYLQGIVKFLSHERETAWKMMEIKQNHAFLKTLEKQKQKKLSEDDERTISDLEEWNPTLLRFFEGLSESTVEQHATFKKFYYSLHQLMEEFEKIDDNYKSFMKKNLKQLAKKMDDVEDSSKTQKKILSRYYDETKKYSKDAVGTISDVKLVEAHTYKQVELLTERAASIKKFIQEMIEYETTINQTFKERFMVYVSGEEVIFKLTSRMMAIPKLIENIDTQQAAVKTKYFERHLVSEATFIKIKTFSGFMETDRLVAVNKYLGMTGATIVSMFDIHKAMKEFVQHVVFRRWDLQLSEGWIVESWTKCQGYITLDNIFILFGEDSKPLRVINTKNTKIESMQDNEVFLNESNKGLFGKSSEEYKIKFENKDTLEEFQLYLDNKIT